MTHEQRAKRRAKIAAYCRRHSVGSAAREFAVSTNTVRDACEEHGVDPITDAPVSVRDRPLRVIAALVTGRASYASVAKRVGVTRQAVADLASRCDAAGIPIKPRG